MSAHADAGDTGDSSEPHSSLEDACREQVRAFIAERFAGDGGDDLAQLVVGVLEAQGYETETQPGRGGLIFARDSRGPVRPRLIAQVAPSDRPVSMPDLQALDQTLKSIHGADQALLVAWGGTDHIAAEQVRHQFFRFRVWDADDLVDAVLRNYNKLSEELRVRLPLKRVWLPAGE